MVLSSRVAPRGWFEGMILTLKPDPPVLVLLRASGCSIGPLLISAVALSLLLEPPTSTQPPGFRLAMPPELERCTGGGVLVLES